MAEQNDQNDLDELVERYLPGSTPECPTFLGDSQYRPIIDGASYCCELAEHLDALQAGDAIGVVGLEVDPDLELTGRDRDDPRALPLGERLAQAAQRGVEVRVLVAGKTAFATVPPAVLGPFRSNIADVERLRAWRPVGADTAPLADRVGFDFSGPVLGSNHQKIVVIRRAGELIAYVGGVDLAANSRDAAPHDGKRLYRRRWGWHDLAVQLRGPAALRVWDEVRRRWTETRALPQRHDRGPSLHPSPRAVLRARPVNPPNLAPPLPELPAPTPVANPGVAVRVQRSVSPVAVDSWLPWRRATWTATPVGGYQEIFATLVRAIGAAQRFVYVEDQYLEESLGAEGRYELYPHLRAAVERGAKLIFVGSGVRDPEDLGLRLRRINRRVTADIQKKIVDELPPHRRGDVAVWRVQHATVHAKLVLVDDVFANIGSANMFARSMSGVDCEISASVVAETSLVRDLRVAIWAEHLRAPLTPELRTSLENLDLALGIWRPEWLPEGADRSTWRLPDLPDGFLPDERVLAFVGPS